VDRSADGLRLVDPLRVARCVLLFAPMIPNSTRCRVRPLVANSQNKAHAAA
jgi:hypothetical protein